MKENYFENPDIIKSIKDYALKSLDRRPLNSIKGKTALLILDMQKYFCNPDSHAYVPASEYIIPRITKLAEKFNENNSLIIKTRHLNNDDDAAMMSVWWKDIIRYDKPSSTLIKEINKINATIIHKSQYDAFYASGLNRLLKDNDIKNVIITGLMSHLCCETTARSAFVRGYNVIFPADANATYKFSYHESTIKNLSHGFARICLCDDIINNRNIYA